MVGKQNKAMIYVEMGGIDISSQVDLIYLLLAEQPLPGSGIRKHFVSISDGSGSLDAFSFSSSIGIPVPCDLPQPECLKHEPCDLWM
jgi:hypothetical protein